MNFTLSHFNCPLHITNRQDFDRLGPTKVHFDSIAIDDVALHKWERDELIGVTDLNFTTSINVKYGTGVLKAGLPKIICLIELDQVINTTWPQSRQAERRCQVVFFEDAIYKINSQPYDHKIIYTIWNAATFLNGGKTAHSTLKLPLNIQIIETPTCNIIKNFGMGKVLQPCQLVKWDECTMAHKSIGSTSLYTKRFEKK